MSSAQKISTSRLTGHTCTIRQVRELVDKVAGTEANVLILGESGTGKEVVARSVHDCSKRARHPFVPVNCGAIPAELLESELFGHKKGAFTGAIQSHKGRFEMAQGGTLFLDEIGDMPMPMQVKLLRVIQERQFEPVGSNTTVKVDVRIIAATHRNPEALIAENMFRMDLYYRLNVFPIRVPPLRERTDDIPLLVTEMQARLKGEWGAWVNLKPCVIASLKRHDWQGNVRELSNLVERLAILYPEQTIGVSSLPEKYRHRVPDLISYPPVNISQPDSEAQMERGLPEEGFDLKELLNRIESEYIEEALERSGWVVARAAKLLKLQRTTMVEKMRKHVISRKAQAS